MTTAEAASRTGRQLPWQAPGWLDEARAWISTRLAEAGYRPLGEVEVIHMRPWSAFLRVPTDKGDAWFKAPGPGYAEAALTQALARWRPDCTPTLIAADAGRGWLLTAHAGPTLRALGQTPAQIAHWLKILPAYARFQQDLAPRTAEMLALGMPDRRLAALPGLFTGLLVDAACLRMGKPMGLSEAEYARLQALPEKTAGLYTELAAFGLPETLAHEELHENNVLYDGSRYIYTDWSDASVAHPFFSLLVTLRATAYWLKLPEDGTEIAGMRDAYLGAWTNYAPLLALRHALEIAMPLAMLNRALSWQQALGGLDESVCADYLDSVPGWLQDFLAAMGG